MAIAEKFLHTIKITGTDFTEDEFIKLVYPSISPSSFYDIEYKDKDGNLA